MKQVDSVSAEQAGARASQGWKCIDVQMFWA